MTLPVRKPYGTPSLVADKALLLLRQLGLSDEALDELLALPAPPAGPERRAAPRPDARCAPQEHPPGSGAEAQTPTALRRQLLLFQARGVLLQLSARCEDAAADLIAKRQGPSADEPAPLKAARDRAIGRSYGVLRLR